MTEQKKQNSADPDRALSAQSSQLWLLPGTLYRRKILISHSDIYIRNALITITVIRTIIIIIFLGKWGLTWFLKYTDWKVRSSLHCTWERLLRLTYFGSFLDLTTWFCCLILTKQLPFNNVTHVLEEISGSLQGPCAFALCPFVWHIEGCDKRNC